MKKPGASPPKLGGTKTRVLIVEDDPTARESLVATVEAIPGMVVTAAVGSVQAALRESAKCPELILVDLQLPDGEGIEVVGEAVRLGRSRTLVVSVFGDEEHVIAALAAGADGYVLKDSYDIAQAIMQVMTGEAPMSASIAAHLLRRWRVPGAARRAALVTSQLTPREQQLLECLARGISYREAAVELDLSPHTVADYIKGIYRKLAVNSRGAAVFAAVRSGIIDLPAPR